MFERFGHQPKGGSSAASFRNNMENRMSIKKLIFIALGCVSLSLGTIGLFLPILPTTPFLLLSSYCFMCSSEKLHRWLLSRKVLGKYIYNYMTYRAISLSAKILSITFLWITLAISIFLINNWIIRAVLLFVGFAVTVHLLKLRTIEK